MSGEHPLAAVKIGFEGHQCFKERQDLGSIKPINVIIGRNNSGKSSLLDVIKMLSTHKDPNRHMPMGVKIFISHEISDDESRALSSSMESVYGNVTFSLSRGVKWRVLESFQERDADKLNKGFAEKITNRCMDHINGLKYYRLRADRDVRAEELNKEYQENGSGVSAIVTKYLTHKDYSPDIVKQHLMDSLNLIFNPDADFVDIMTRTSSSGELWELYLKEVDKGLIPLSASGSGLKTVISTLAVLMLLPTADIDKHVFLLEELENNLHPTIQRKLFQFLRDFAVENGCTIFTTTHSHVAIDLFSGDEQAQIYHVQHDGEKSSVVRVNGYRAMVDVLDNIGVKASDLLQANGVIWCEGPSDAVYLQRWIELWSGERLKNNVHYQCMFYGGGLIRYLGAGEAEGDAPNLSHLIDVLHINKNVVLLADSDKASQDEGLKPNLEKVKGSLEKDNHMCWVTEGREIEQYIPESVLTEYYSKTENRKAGHAFPDDGTGVLGQFEKFEDFRSRVAGYKVSTWKGEKVSLARDICPLLTRENLAGHMDLTEKLDRLVAKLYSWNEMQPDS